uniref:Uncharacterized protein n=1 Tax=Daucus carota subsp. sativus TaxID=79200 RepID=A0A161XRK0_DAUCS
MPALTAGLSAADADKMIKKLKQRQDILATLKAKPPRKGKAILRPRQSLSDLLDRSEASQFAEGSREASQDISGHIFGMMSTILCEVDEMVRSLPTRQVTQPVVDQELSKLAAATFPGPVQELFRTDYVCAAKGLLSQILKNNDKVIVEVSQQQQLEGNGKEQQQQPEGKGKEAASTEKNPYEDDYDVNAFLYPLFD